MGNIPVYPMDELENILSSYKVDIAVLATPTQCAQENLDRLYAGGVRAVWNFAPTDLSHPADMIVVNVHLSDSLQILSYRIAHRDDG